MKTRKSLIRVLGLLIGFVAIVFMLSAESNWKTEELKINDRIGSIITSQAKIWRESQVMPFIGEQLSMVQQMGKAFDADALQGVRRSGSSSTLQVQGAATLSFPPALLEASTNDKLITASGATLPAPVTVEPAPNSNISPVITFKSSDNRIIPEAIDRLARIDDYYGIYEATRLEHLRDSTSMEPGWSMYMLGFNISIQPGEITRENYQAMVTYAIDTMTITHGNTVTKITPDSMTINNGAPMTGKKLSDFVRIYYVYPQRYSLQYAEDMSNLASLLASAQASAPANPAAPGTALGGSVGYGRKYMESLEQIQTYPLISGFVNPDNTFGWVFNPRPRIVSKPCKRVGIEGEMLEGNYAVTALIMIKDDSQNYPSWVYRISEKDLCGYFKLKKDGDHCEADSDGQFRPDLLKELFRQYTDYYLNYANLVDNVDPNPNEEVNDPKFAIEYEHLVKVYDTYMNCTDGNPEADNLAGLIPTGDIKNSLLKYNQTLSRTPMPCPTNCPPQKPQCNELQLREELARTWQYVQICALWGEETRHEKINLAINFKPEWRPYDIDYQDKLSLEPPSVYEGNTVLISQELPKKAHRALRGIYQVSPDTAPGNQDNWVLIRGQGFGNDAIVLAGSQMANSSFWSVLKA